MSRFEKVLMFLGFSTVLTVPVLSESGPDAALRACDGLSRAIKNEIRAPYKPVTGRISKTCVQQTSVKMATLHLFVVAAFYHDDREVRRTALRKLSEFKCRGKEACSDVRALVGEHVRATVKANPDDWSDFSSEVLALTEQVRMPAGD